MNKWSSIGGFHNVRKTLQVYPNLHSGEIAYRAKVKLHGTNGGIAIYPDGRVEAQSRTSVLHPKEDNANFCKQGVLAREDFWSGLADDEVITVYGEWCGPGIEKGTAINKIDGKIFAVFAIQIGDSVADEFGYDHASTLVDPPAITSFLRAAGQIPSNVRVIPWYGDEIKVDYANKASMKSAVALMNDVVKAVEKNDPWVKNEFNEDGIGEGVVYYPISFMSPAGHFDQYQMSTFSFKAKGAEHKNVKTKKAVQIDPEVASSIDGFVTMVVTPARLEQGAREVAGGELDFHQRHIGAFLKWMGQDVQKETADELVASGLTWDQVSRPVSTEARTWYLKKFEEI